jgi:hypothetical protein
MRSVVLLALAAGCNSGFMQTSGCFGNDACLSALSVSVGVLTPDFSPSTTRYSVKLPFAQDSISLTATVLQPADTTLVIDGVLTMNATPTKKALPDLGEYQYTIVVSAGGGTQRTYTVLVERGVEFDGYFKASNTGPSDTFGNGVAVSGNTLVVGAPHESSNGKGIDPDTQSDDTAPQSGAVYVFVRVDGAWSQQAYLKAANAGAGDAFGWSVAIDGDTLVVGAPKEDGSGVNVDPPSDDNALDSGAAYVFVRSGTTWTQQAYLKASNTDGGDDFGNSVSIFADTVVVGADLEAGNGAGGPADNSMKGAGAAYIFERRGTTWGAPAYLKASNADAGDGFGASVATSAGWVAVGAYGEDSSGAGPMDNSMPNAGAVYVFNKNPGWVQNAYLKASNPDANDDFGAAVAIYFNTLVVGSPGESSNGTTQSDNSLPASGAAYVDVFLGSSWSQLGYLKATNPDAGDSFGGSVAVYDTAVVVGAAGESGNGAKVNSSATADNSLLQSGAAYLYFQNGLSWMPLAYLKASDPQQGAQLGTVAVAADTIAIGAIGEQSASTGIDSMPDTNFSMLQPGAVYAFQYQ